MNISRVPVYKFFVLQGQKRREISQIFATFENRKFRQQRFAVECKYLIKKEIRTSGLSKYLSKLGDNIVSE